MWLYISGIGFNVWFLKWYFVYLWSNIPHQNVNSVRLEFWSVFFMVPFVFRIVPNTQ